MRVLQDSPPITINQNSGEQIMSPANPNMQRHSTNLVNPDNPIFQREPDKKPTAASFGQAAAVQTGTAPLPTTQTPLLNEEVENPVDGLGGSQGASDAAGAPSDADLDAIAAEEAAAAATGVQLVSDPSPAGDTDQALVPATEAAIENADQAAHNAVEAAHQADRAADDAVANAKAVSS